MTGEREINCETLHYAQSDKRRCHSERSEGSDFNRVIHSVYPLRRTRMRGFCLILIWSFCLVSYGAAQTKSVGDLANYRGADREEMLKAGAKKEGKLVWYTSLTAHRDIANVFEAKYPGIKVETYRAGPNDLTRRLLSEAQARRNLADLIETTPSTLMMMRDSKLLMPYFSPHLGNFPDDAKEEADKSRVLWTTDRESIVGLGYNRNLIKANEVPKNF